MLIVIYIFISILLLEKNVSCNINNSFSRKPRQKFVFYIKKLDGNNVLYLNKTLKFEPLRRNRFTFIGYEQKNGEFKGKIKTNLYKKKNICIDTNNRETPFILKEECPEQIIMNIKKNNLKTESQKSGLNQTKYYFELDEEINNHILRDVKLNYNLNGSSLDQNNQIELQLQFKNNFSGVLDNPEYNGVLDVSKKGSSKQLTSKITEDGKIYTANFKYAPRKEFSLKITTNNYNNSQIFTFVKFKCIGKVDEIDRIGKNGDIIKVNKNDVEKKYECVGSSWQHIPEVTISSTTRIITSSENITTLTSKHSITNNPVTSHSGSSKKKITISDNINGIIDKNISKKSTTYYTEEIIKTGVVYQSNKDVNTTRSTSKKFTYISYPTTIFTHNKLQETQITNIPPLICTFNQILINGACRCKNTFKKNKKGVCIKICLPDEYHENNICKKCKSPFKIVNEKKNGCKNNSKVISIIISIPLCVILIVCGIVGGIFIYRHYFKKKDEILISSSSDICLHMHEDKFIPNNDSKDKLIQNRLSLKEKRNDKNFTVVNKGNENIKNEKIVEKNKLQTKNNDDNIETTEGYNDHNNEKECATNSEKNTDDEGETSEIVDHENFRIKHRRSVNKEDKNNSEIENYNKSEDNNSESDQGIKNEYESKNEIGNENEYETKNENENESKNEKGNENEYESKNENGNENEYESKNENGNENEYESKNENGNENGMKT